VLHLVLMIFWTCWKCSKFERCRVRILSHR